VTPVLTEADLDRIEAHARTPAWKVTHSETRQHVRDLVAEVRRLQAELDEESRDHEVTMTRLMISPQWSTVPPGPEHEGRWFWVRHSTDISWARWVKDEDAFFWRERDQQLFFPIVFDAWAGPIPEPSE